ncbi:sensor domain-containing phosphodiesterase [Alteromonas sp. D210916BOD_24]|uniref:sensor domain-containing phosphodiesterase n=1 Tax=Alteromonas sp. D210916BOD_24 TaxID=3157618 RepID=UPI00399C69AE
MNTPPISYNELDRLAVLQRLDILDTEPEERFDRITRLAQQIFNSDFCTISLIDKDRQWFKSTVNIDMKESTRDTAFCAHTILEDQYMVVPDTLDDERFVDNPFVVGDPKVRSYAGANLIVQGQRVGTLCVFGNAPRSFSDQQVQQLIDLAKVVESELQRHDNTRLLKEIHQYQLQFEESQKLVRVRSKILEKIVTSESLSVVLREIVEAIENEYLHQKCSILLLENNRLKMGAAPSLPDFYNDAIDGVEIGPELGSCGNTAFTNALTVVEDISTHPYWTAWADIAQRANLRSCWSQPIRGTNNEVLGTFAIYHEDVSKPSPEAILLIEQFAHIASIAIERERANQLIWHQANFDVLTALPNRNLMEEQLKHLLATAKREKTKVAVLFLDLDNFKEVNDTLGHDVGDLLLVECAKRILQCIRQDDTAARLGGDEFVILLGGAHNERFLDKLIQNLLGVISEPYLLNQKKIHSSASIGVTLFPDDADNVTSLLKNADQAMYGAKAQGKNSHRYYSKDMQESALKRLSYKNDLRYAIEHKQFYIEYQPIVDLQQNRMHKAEALIRWRHPEKGIIRPDEFIPIAEESGAIIDISNWVFEQVCEDAYRWRKQLCPDLQISVNTSPSHYFCREPNIMNWLLVLLDKGLPPHAVVLEITENLLMDANSLVSKKLFQFRQAGVGIALDDFGTGYSSISYLKKFPTDFIKIDRSFVHSMTEVSNDKVLCEAIIVMAKKLGIQVVAEGIETQEQLAILKKMGCDYAQGYYFSKPLGKVAFETLLTKQCQQ